MGNPIQYLGPGRVFKQISRKVMRIHLRPKGGRPGGGVGVSNPLLLKPLVHPSAIRRGSLCLGVRILRNSITTVRLSYETIMIVSRGCAARLNGTASFTETGQDQGDR